MSFFTRPKPQADPIESVTPPLGYVIHEVLGEGAEGRVYRATDNFFAREVVLKPMEVGRGHQNVESIQRSMALANMINSEFVNPAIAAVVQDKYVWLVGGYADGLSLRDVLKSGPLDDDSLFHIISDVAAGLDAIHSVGVVHNDISPRNLIVGAAGTTKITDFGASSRLGDPCPGAGTPGYIAPEKVGGQPSSYALDSFALGSLIIRILGGELIDTGDKKYFQAPSIDEQPTRLRKELARLARDLIASDPDRRPGTAGVIHALQRMARMSSPGSRDALADLVRAQMSEHKKAATQVFENRAQLPSFWQRNRLVLVGAGMILMTVLSSTYLLLNPRIPAIQPTTLASDVRTPLPINLSLSWLDTHLASHSESLWQYWPMLSQQVLHLSVRCSVDFCQLSLSHQNGENKPHDHLASIGDFAIEDPAVWDTTLFDLAYQATIR